MLTEVQWGKLVNHVRSKLRAMFDPASIFAEAPNLEADLSYQHKGFYIGIVSAEGAELLREGFLREATSLKQSSDVAIVNLFAKLKDKNVSVSTLDTSSFYFTVIHEVTYIPDPLAWNENDDGVYFMWGQNYRGLYLPYQIRRMGVSKVETLDRLCTWECGLVSNLWRLPCGLVWRLGCESHTA